MDPSSHTRDGHWMRAVLVIALLATCTGCGLRPLPSPALVRAGNEPSLFLESGRDAAKIGYVSSDVQLEITGRAQEGRVPVRIDGALRTRGFVDASTVSLIVQRRGRLRGTPIYVGPDDVVNVIGTHGLRLEVRAQATHHGRPFGPSYYGTYPREGLSASAAAQTATRPDEGNLYTVPPRLSVPLFDAPNGALICDLPALEEPYEVRVVNQFQNWLAVRAGDGPYLVGWTPLALAPATPEVPRSAAADPLVAVNGAQLPRRIAEEVGALKRVAAGTKVVFADAVIGVLKREGYARVVQAYDEAGYADVFVAADDSVALRGLVRNVDLSDPP